MSAFPASSLNMMAHTPSLEVALSGLPFTRAGGILCMARDAQVPPTHTIGEVR
jgi:hypothetical protein